MKIRDLFNMMHKANEFRGMLGECKYRFNVCIGDFSLGALISLGSVLSYEKFEQLLADELHPDAARAILHADAMPGVCKRSFVVRYEFDGQPRRLTLYTE